MAKQTAPKQPAPPAIASREEAEAAMARIGELQRLLHAHNAEFDSAVARLNLERAPVLETLQAQIKALGTGLGTWAAKHRTEICAEGRKTARFATGEIVWRDGKPKVWVDDEEAVITTFLAHGLEDLVRVRQEINKEAILEDPSRIEGLAGIAVVSGAEKMTIRPDQTEIEAVEIAVAAKRGRA